MNRVIGALLAMGLFGVSASVRAELPYFGVDYINTTYDFESVNGSFSSSDSGFRIYAGFPVSESVSIETGWNDQGEASASYSTWGGGHEKIAVEGIQISLLGRLPLQGGTNLFGRLGLYVWDADYTDVWTGGGMKITANDNGTDIFYGVGVDFRASSTLSLRVEYTLVPLDVLDGEINANYASLGLSFR